MKQKLAKCLHADRTQFGYMTGSSATCALLKIQHTIINILDDNTTDGCIMLCFDFSKAFDSVNHNILIAKLMSLGLPLEFVVWCKSYLSDRKQRVRHGNTFSHFINCTSGVPQGSKLAPLLYSLYTMEIAPKFPFTTCSKFADDTTFLIPIPKNTPSEIVMKIIKDEVEHLNQTANSLYLQINLTKTKVLPIVKRNYTFPVEIDTCDSVRLLGVIFSRNLDWRKHFEVKIKLCSQRIYALKVIKQILPRKSLIQVYVALVLSVLEYGNPLFIGLSSAIQNKIDRIQKRCHNIIDGRDCTCTDFPNLIMRRKSQSMSLFNKILVNKNHVLQDILFKLNVRNNFLLPHCKTNRLLNSFIFHCSWEHIHAS